VRRADREQGCQPDGQRDAAKRVDVGSPVAGTGQRVRTMATTPLGIPFDVRQVMPDERLVTPHRRVHVSGSRARSRAMSATRSKLGL
jgi:hypothetical protein